jgi:hypothetical protein
MMNENIIDPFLRGGVLLGEDRGFNEAADVLYAAADGTDLNDFWDEVQQTVALRNQQRNRLIDALTYRVTDLAEEVTAPAPVDFEEASEYGLPKGIRTGFTQLWRGFDFKFYDLAVRYTWRFIADSTQGQLRQLNNAALEADNRLVYSRVMRRLFNPLNGTGITDNNLPVTVYGFYNGDSEVPPAWKSNTFTAPHNHYLTSQGAVASATLTPAVSEHLLTNIAQHGYTYQDGYKLVLWVNKQEADIIKTWRAGVGGALWDFIPDPSTYGGGFYVPTDQRLVGAPQGRVEGQIGTYGPWHVVEEELIPAGYIVGIATGGTNNISNPIGVREHKNPRYRGLKVIPGNNNDYPLIESYYQRGLGTGIRHRGAGAVYQISGNANYTTPAAYV